MEIDRNELKQQNKIRFDDEYDINTNEKIIKMIKLELINIELIKIELIKIEMIIIEMVRPEYIMKGKLKTPEEEIISLEEIIL